MSPADPVNARAGSDGSSPEYPVIVNRFSAWRYTRPDGSQRMRFAGSVHPTCRLRSLTYVALSMKKLLMDPLVLSFWFRRGYLAFWLPGLVQPSSPATQNEFVRRSFMTFVEKSRNT